MARVLKNKSLMIANAEIGDAPLASNINSGANTMSTTDETKKPETQELTKKYKYFDFTSFEEKTEEKKVPFTPAASYQEAVERLDSDEKVLLNALNDALREQALANARKEVLAKGAPKKIVLEFIKPWRQLPQFASMVTLEKGQAGWKEQYKKQTTSLLTEVAKNEFMLNGIRAAAAASTSDDDDDSDE